MHLVLFVLMAFDAYCGGRDDLCLIQQSTIATMAKIIENLEIFIVLRLGYLMIIKHFQNISMQLYCN